MSQVRTRRPMPTLSRLAALLSAGVIRSRFFYNTLELGDKVEIRG